MHIPFTGVTAKFETVGVLVVPPQAAIRAVAIAAKKNLIERIVNPIRLKNFADANLRSHFFYEFCPFFPGNLGKTPVTRIFRLFYTVVFLLYRASESLQELTRHPAWRRWSLEQEIKPFSTELRWRTVRMV